MAEDQRAASPAPSAHSTGTSITASQVQLPAWVSSLTGGGASSASASAAAAAEAALSDDQRARLDQARTFARQLTAKVGETCPEYSMRFLLRENALIFEFLHDS